jgi:deazaflavin-dependent oxidoreductase (nitroreductase family)
MAVNAFLIRITNGQIGGRLGTQTILLLECIGRKSGRPHVVPIAYFFYEGKFLIVESNWGKDRHADWYLNLRKNPRATLLVNGKKISAVFHEAEGDQYTRLWKYVTDRHRPYLHYQEMTTRRIPIVVLHPID